ncbi:MAG: hypothetical protein K2F96_01070 [Muribaculaceae bacterium]|nr:hypothetical protein [Muribaculaceae bacterium]
MLTRELAAKLRNPDLRFVTELVSGEGSPLAWTEKQVLEHLMDQNENVRKLVESLRLSLD